MKILITGGAGYVGTELTQRLACRADVSEIVIYDNLSERDYALFLDARKMEAPRIRFLRGDILDSRSVAVALRDVDVVYHLAARVTTPFSHEDASQFEQVNHWGTAALVNAVEESGVGSFIYLSSTAVYGFSEKPCDISSKPYPQGFYGSSKLRAERWVETLADKTKTYILRSGNVYGYSPGMRFDALVNRVLFDAHFTGRVQIDGDGTQARPLIDVSNVVSCLERIPRSALPPGTYNLVQRNLTVREILEQVREICTKVETLFVNQHIEFKGVRVLRDERLEALMPNLDQAFESELRGTLDRFAF
jgi:UDP-glucose 4-epimerase